MIADANNNADILITNGMVFTVDDQGTFVEDGAVAVTDGKIVAVGPASNLSHYQAGETIDAQGMLIMPGLINTHTHLPMSLFRGLADDLPLEQWLQDHIFPAEARFITPENVRLGTQLSVAELLLSGTTTCCDGYFMAPDIAEAISPTGMRATLGQGVIDFPAPGVPDPKKNIDVAAGFAKRWRGEDALVSASIFCHSPYTCSPETLQAAKAAANEAGVLFQIHVAETRNEERQCRQAHGCTPVQYLARLELLDHRTLLVHAVWVDDADLDTIARHRARVIHCPESNMKLASGVAPVSDMLAKGITVGLGTDGCASNNDLDLFGEMDMAAKLHKVNQLESTVMDAATVVRMATIHGARALGLDHRIGSLEVGKEADLIMLDMAQPHLVPMYQPESHLVYAVNGGDVHNVMIAGRWVVMDRRLMTLDLDALLRQAGKMGRIIADMAAKGE